MELDLRRWEDAITAEIKIHWRTSAVQLLGLPPKPRNLKRIQKSLTDLQPGDVTVFHLDFGRICKRSFQTPAFLEARESKVE